MTHTIERLGSEQVVVAVDVLCEAFFDYPVMRYVLGVESKAYRRDLETLMHFFVMARIHRNEVLLGIADHDGWAGTALVSRLPGRESPPALTDLRRSVWKELGSAARDRQEAFCAAGEGIGEDRPHMHLNMIGVRQRAKGRGLGRSLIDHVHEMSRLEPQSVGVSLTTEDESNVSLYQHFGYRILGEAPVTAELRSWFFFRPDASE